MTAFILSTYIYYLASIFGNIGLMQMTEIYRLVPTICIGTGIYCLVLMTFGDFFRYHPVFEPAMLIYHISFIVNLLLSGVTILYLIT